MADVNSSLDYRSMERKLENTQNQIDRFKQQIQKERENKYLVEEKMRNLRKTIRDEFEVKMEK